MVKTSINLHSKIKQGCAIAIVLRSALTLYFNWGNDIGLMAMVAIVGWMDKVFGDE